MTPFLRKAHRYIWFSFAVLLPVGWLAAVLAIPDAVWQQPVRPEEPEQLPLEVRSTQSGDFVISLRQDSSGTQRQIEILITRPLTNPNTMLLLEKANNREDKTLLGLLGSRGIHRFNLDSTAARSNTLTLRFEDNIQGRLLRTVELHP
jgi:hypothetical protein